VVTTIEPSLPLWLKILTNIFNKKFKVTHYVVLIKNDFTFYTAAMKPSPFAQFFIHFLEK